MGGEWEGMGEMWQKVVDFGGKWSKVVDVTQIGELTFELTYKKFD